MTNAKRSTKLRKKMVPFSILPFSACSSFFARASRFHNRFHTLEGHKTLSANKGKGKERTSISHLFSLLSSCWWMVTKTFVKHEHYCLSLAPLGTEIHLYTAGEQHLGIIKGASCETQFIFNIQKWYCIYPLYFLGPFCSEVW